jgi:uncharacterized protein Yka (UPF0111/DUF47 family)
MPRRRTATNGAGAIEQAMAQLVQNQAALVAQHTAFLSQLDETRLAFARMEKDLEQIKAIVIRHEQRLDELTDAIRQKIGFQPK